MHDTWLKENALERMDANRKDLFHPTRCKFHKDRYRFALPYVGGKDVLDVACGTGYGANLYLEAGKPKKTWGIDINPEVIEYAKATYSGIEFLCASATNLPLKDESVDVVTSFETLEHVDDEQKQLSEIFRILRPGGYYILSVPNDWRDEKNNPHHLRNYDYLSVQAAVKGFFEIEVIYNQNSGMMDRPENHEQPEGFVKTNEDNYDVAECFVLVARKAKR